MHLLLNNWRRKCQTELSIMRSRTAIICLFLLLVGVLSFTVGRFITRASTPTATISVNATTSNGKTLQTQMSTNSVWSGMLDQAPGAQARLDALKAPLVRLHVGDDGWPEAMPELNYDRWNFSALNALVNDVRKSGRHPLMNIKFAPDWMWTCYPHSIGVSANMTQGTGRVKDLTFQTYAKYMARLVSYYNKGSMTTETGQVITNPAGTGDRVTWWEPWNEPDLNNETPCAPSNGVGLTASEYVTMWNAVTAAMLAVDPALKFVGPATAGAQFGSSQTDSYVSSLMSGAIHKPDAISIHEYGYWDNSVTDKTIFDGDATGSGGIPSILSDVRTTRSYYPTTPIWITEMNVNAAWGNDPYKRPWTAFGAAWWGAVFQSLAPLGVGLINQYDVVDSPQFGLLDDRTGKPYLPYWEEMLLDRGFPAGSTILSSSSSHSGILSLAVQMRDGTMSVLVVNRQLNANSSKGGPGVAATVVVKLQGVTPASLTVRQIDSTTNASTGPVTQTLPVSSSPTLTFGGYGFAVLTITTNGQSTATPKATNTPTLTATPTYTATSTPSATVTPPGNCAALFCDGFESVTLPGDFSNTTVSSGNSLTLDSRLAHSGPYSLKAVTTKGSAGNAYITKRLLSGQGTLDTHAYLYLSNPVDWAGVQLLTYYAQGNAIAQVTYNVDPTSPSLQVYVVANNRWYSCTRAPGLDAWHSFGLRVTLATTAAGSFTLQLDGTTVCSASGIKTSSISGASINQVNLGSDTSDSSGGLTIHVDDVAIGTSHIGQ